MLNPSFFLLKELRDKLVAHINEIGAKEGRERDKILKELLSKSFSLVRLKALRPIIMCILRNTTHIDDKYLRVLVRKIIFLLESINNSMNQI